MQEWISSPIGMHPVESGQWVLAADAYAERDRLAAENAELKEDAIRDAGIECDLKAKLAAANDTQDRFRDVVPKGWHWCADCEKMTPPDDEDPDFCGVCESENYWHRGVHVALQTILYPENET